MQHFDTTPLSEMQPGEMQFGEMQLSLYIGVCITNNYKTNKSRCTFFFKKNIYIYIYIIDN